MKIRTMLAVVGVCGAMFWSGSAQAEEPLDRANLREAGLLGMLARGGRSAQQVLSLGGMGDLSPAASRLRASQFADGAQRTLPTGAARAASVSIGGLSLSGEGSEPLHPHRTVVPR